MTRWLRVCENLYRRGDGPSICLRMRVGGVLQATNLGKISLTEAKKIRDESRVKNARAIVNLEPIQTPKPVPLGDLLDGYLKICKHRIAPSTHQGYENYSRRLKAAFRDLDARLLTERDWVGYVDRRLKDEVSPKTINNELVFLRGALDRFSGRGRPLSGNPLAHVEKLPEPEPGSIAHEFSEEEISRLLQRAMPWFRRFITVALETGCREGELAKLALGDVSQDSEMPGITFRAENVKGRRGKRRSRWVPLSPGALQALQEQIAESTRLGSIFVFPSRRDARLPIAGHIASSAWEALRKKTEVSGRFHDLRHTFITRKLLAGFAPSLVAKFVGHSSTAMIERNYGHLWRGHREDLAKLVQVSREERKSVAPAWSLADSADSEKVSKALTTRH